jgi:energy-converting hydrogenase Eha subunit F
MRTLLISVLLNLIMKKYHIIVMKLNSMRCGTHVASMGGGGGKFKILYYSGTLREKNISSIIFMIVGFGLS